MTTEIAGGELRETTTFCRFCVAVCGLTITTRNDTVVGVRGDRQHPISRGYTCVKGRGAGLLHHSPDRLDVPQIRRHRVAADVTWPEMLDDVAARLRSILDESGPDAIAVYAGTTSEQDAAGAYAARRFFRAIGSTSRYTALTVDTPCKPYVAALVAGDPRLAPQVDDEGVRLTLVIGTNPVASHGHTYGYPDPVRRLRALTQRGEVWVLDPRRTETAHQASRHLALRPGTDWAVIGHLVREVLRTRAASAAASCDGLDILAGAVESLNAERAAGIAGVTVDDLAELRQALARAGRLGVMTGTGATMAPSSNVTEWMLWSLLAVTDSLDQPGGMWFNPGFLHQDDLREPLPRSSPSRPGIPGDPPMPRLFQELPCAALAGEIERRRVRALFVIGGNPLTAFPQPQRLRAAFETLDVLAVLDVLRSDTGDVATHVLPCAGQLERADVPVGIDRAMTAVASQHTGAVVPLGAHRRPVWWILAQLADRLGHSILPDDRRPDECDDDVVLDVLARGGRVELDELRRAPTAVVDAPRVFGWIQRRVGSGRRWDLAPEPLVEQLTDLLAGVPRGDDLLRLVPHRRIHTFNSMRDAWNRDRVGVPRLAMNAHDAVRAGVVDGDEVEVRSPAGAVSAHVVVEPSLATGVVALAHGSMHPNVNDLVSDVRDIDPLTGMVRLTDVPVTVTRVDMGRS
jgi:anaerobic selenocysteine-containing dehydrogenase